MGKLIEVYNYISSFIDDNSYPPTVRDICAHFGFKSTSTAQYYLVKLESKGLITKETLRKRSIAIPEKRKNNVRLIPEIGEVTAGEPIFATENFVGYCPVSDDFNSTDDLFILKVKGTSMIGAGILNGDKIIVKRMSTCDDGDIVVALVDDAATCKRLYKRNGKIILHPENEELKDMIFDEVSVLGKVIGLIRKF